MKILEALNRAFCISALSTMLQSSVISILMLRRVGDAGDGVAALWKQLGAACNDALMACLMAS